MAGAGAEGGEGDPEEAAAETPLKVVFPVARRDATPRWADYGEGNWWLDPAAALFPPDEAVELEWTPEALFQCVHGPDGAPEVEVVLGSDNSVLRSFQGGRFFRHVLLGPEGALERVYSADSPPQGLQAPPTGTLAKLDSVLAHARALLLHRRRLAGDGPGGAPSRPQAPAGGPPGELDEAAVLSNEVREDCEVEDVGRFVAFSDGRVWAKFVDRTMARLDRWHRRCRLVLPDGSAVEVRPAAPVGVEKYMAFVADFAVWAFRTPGERAAALEAQAAVEACANRAGQMARLLQWELSHELPERRARLAGPVKPPPPPWGGPAAGPLPGEGAVAGYSHEDIRGLLERNASLLERLSGEALVSGA